MEEANKPAYSELANAEEDEDAADVGDYDKLADNDLVEVEEEDINKLADEEPAYGKQADNDLANEDNDDNLVDKEDENEPEDKEDDNKPEDEEDDDDVQDIQER